MVRPNNRDMDPHHAHNIHHTKDANPGQAEAWGGGLGPSDLGVKQRPAREGLKR